MRKVLVTTFIDTLIPSDITYLKCLYGENINDLNYINYLKEKAVIEICKDLDVFLKEKNKIVIIKEKKESYFYKKSLTKFKELLYDYKSQIIIPTQLKENVFSALDEKDEISTIGNEKDLDLLLKSISLNNKSYLIHNPLLEPIINKIPAKDIINRIVNIKSVLLKMTGEEKAKEKEKLINLYENKKLDKLSLYKICILYEFAYNSNNQDIINLENIKVYSSFKEYSVKVLK